MWLSCSAFFSQYCESSSLCLVDQPADLVDRVYGLVSWPSRTDKHGDLVRKYCASSLHRLRIADELPGPELKDFPDKVSLPSLPNGS